jgi:hypothetical protein
MNNHIARKMLGTLKGRIANQVWVAQFLIGRTHAYRINLANIWTQ